MCAVGGEGREVSVYARGNQRTGENQAWCSVRVARSVRVERLHGVSEPAVTACVGCVTVGVEPNNHVAEMRVERRYARYR